MLVKDQFIKKNYCPLPLIDDILALIGKRIFFTSLDLKSDYWQVSMDEQDNEKTAFYVSYGFVWIQHYMPFDLSNA